MAGSAILAFTDKVSAAVKEDIKSATLFASLASSSKHDVFSEPEKWYKEYFQILQVLGFSLQATDFSDYKMSSRSMKLDDIILDVLGGLLAVEETLIVEEAIKVIKAQGEGGKSSNILSSNSFSDEDGGFQVYPCIQSPTGDTTLKAGFFHYKLHRKKNIFYL